MYVAIIHYMDVVGQMDDAKFFLFCYMMDKGDFFLFSYPPIPAIVFVEALQTSMVYCLLVTLLRVLCHLWGTHFMYVAIIHYMDVAGQMDNAKFFLFCYMMDKGDFFPLQLPPYSYHRLYGCGWSMKGDEVKFVSRQVYPGRIRHE